MADTTPLERAVEAVAEALVGHVDPCSDSLSEYGIAAKIAPIVIASLREPIEAMMAGPEQMVEMEGSENAQIEVDAYQRVLDMIDAILAEGE